MRIDRTVPIKKQDPETQARQIALDIGNRRKSGELITDDQVLRAHPNLRGPLLVQLERLNRLETARAEADEPESPVAAAPEVISTDHQGTLDLPLIADEAGAVEPQPVAGLSPAAEPPPPTPPLPPPPAPTPLPSKPQAATNSPLTAAPPAESDSGQDNLRITLKEPSHDGGNQSTLVIDEVSQIDSTVAVSKVPRYRPSVRAPMAVVKLFHDGQTTFNQYPIMTDRFRIGRVDGDLIVPHDYWMSGRHAELQRHKRGDRYHWILVDLNSTNGTFVQADFAVLRHQDELFLGQERYRFILQDSNASLMHVTRGAGQQWSISGTKAVIGSQPPCGLKSFATDPYLDPIHARLNREPDGTWAIRDNHSRNGLWYRVKEVEIPPNSEFQLGEQRFGFWTQADHPVKTANLQLASKQLEGTQ